MKKQSHVGEIVVIIVGAGLISLVALAPAYKGGSLDSQNAGQFGDFVGGYIGTILLLASVVLLYSTLRFQANAQAQGEVEKRVFELIKYQRENVAEVGFGDRINGRRTFVLLVREFRETLAITAGLCKTLQPNYTMSEIVDIAYMAFYYGTGPNSDRVLRAALSGYDVNLVDALIRQLSDVEVRKAVQAQRKFSFTPFEGHQSRLGHYFRHLYQTVKYIDREENDSHRARAYVDMLRAQLTNHEQTLLFLNSVSAIGSAWRDSGLISKYALIKNIPKDFFDATREPDPKAFYPSVKFEYEELIRNLKEPNRNGAIEGKPGTSLP